MFARVLLVVLAFCVVPLPAEARRVALVIGQDAYPGGASAAIGLPRLDNPALDARRMAELLAKHGFEVVRCDGKAPGCFNLDRSRFLDVLKTFEQRATGADMALVFYAGHGMGTDEGNILAPIDAKVSCATGAISHGIPVERIMAATRPAKHKLLILDACRNNPLGEVCPNLKNKKRAFTRIEAGAFQGLLLVTSTQFGQEALDGPPGIHSPFAKALFAALEENPNIYFEQAFNQVARATYDAAQKHDAFLQIPGRVVGGEAPADCLAGKACVGDLRMAAMAVENERLTADAAGVRNIIDQEQLTRGSPYTMEERKARVAELERTLASIATSGDPLRQEARRLIDGGNVASGKAKLDEALDADEKALEEAQRVVQEKRQAAAQSARDLAVLTKGTDVVSAVAYYGRATRLDPNNLSTWHEYSRAAQEAGRTSEAKTALEQLAIKAQEAKNTYWQLWSVISLGELVEKHGSLDKARELYEQAFNIWESRGSEPRDGAIVLAKLGHIFRDQGNLALALTKHQQALELIKELATRYPYDTGYQKDLSDSYADIGSVLSRQGNLTGALDQHGTALAIAERLAQNDPANLGWQRLIQAAHEQIGTVLVDQGELAKALESFRASLAIANRLAKADPGNAFSLKALHGA
jgi:tetratricopeptide (TPR) repeat protein